MGDLRTIVPSKRRLTGEQLTSSSWRLRPAPKLEEEATLLSNLRVAFDHLFEQAQMSDRRSRERVEIYYLRPSKELLKTLEFIPGLMGWAIEQGKKDFNNGRFVQFSRPPVFTQIVQTPN
jgi:hypothetical protein